MSVTLEEFLHELLRSSDPVRGELQLNPPEQHLEAVRALQADGRLWGAVTVRRGHLAHPADDDSLDRFHLRNGMLGVSRHWAPGLDRAALETYQALRADGCSPTRAHGLVKALQVQG